ncbi:Uncharacterized protein HSRCO_2782 [Halanaeroarchaeum sp. HSR-CO]|uniref:DUF7561 family protein n=1 Tax=Halanaeroarchaeum sp. HSR-CO TaxID=2866382 RepID=UPI00217E27F3|nr:hypothetical protein [Halanaeroarchaeum sp. HSR-CO]UWG49038.1 Uncharacterized protein HSRCO_2782 [Halanaeroarchaeum sp. HSR-CO]
MGERCAVCGRDVPIAGGIANFWTLDHTETGGMTLELEDGTEHFLCFSCMESLPDHPTEADIEALAAERHD